MPKFIYKAEDTEGNILDGEMEAAEKQGVVESLRGQGYYPIEIREVSVNAKGKSSGKISFKTMSLFCKQVSTILKSGVPLNTALSIMKSQVDDKKFQKILEDVNTSIQMGNSLLDSFRPYERQLPLLFLNMIEAGEMSGTLDSCLERAAASFKSTQRMNSKVKGALIYPICLMVITVAVFIFMMVMVLPMFSDMFEDAGAELPGITQAMIAFSDSLMSSWYIYIAVVAVVIVMFTAILATDGGRTFFDKFVLSAPVIGKLQTKIVAARYSQTLATLSSAGISLVAALDMAGRAVQNRFVQKKIDDIIVAVKNGEGLSRPLERANVFPPMIVHMTKLGEESGSLEDLLEESASFYEGEAEDSTQKMMALMEPMIILVMGGMVLMIVASIMLPLMSMASTVQV